MLCYLATSWLLCWRGECVLFPGNFVYSCTSTVQGFMEVIRDDFHCPHKCSDASGCFSFSGSLFPSVPLVFNHLLCDHVHEPLGSCGFRWMVQVPWRMMIWHIHAIETPIYMYCIQTDTPWMPKIVILCNQIFRNRLKTRIFLHLFPVPTSFYSVHTADSCGQWVTYK